MPAPSLLIVLSVLAAAPAWAETPRERGRYLVEAIAACGNCHTPKGPGGEIAGKKLAGGFIIREEFGEAVTPNITLDPDTGIGRWSDGEVIASIYGARRHGGRVLPPMPTRYYAAGLTEADARAIVAYLRSLLAIKNAVPPPVPPTR